MTGAYPLDVDSDGITDLAVLRHGENVLLRGLGRLPLRARERGAGTSTAGAPGPRPSAPRGRTGEDLPTLAFGNYLVPDETRRTIECDESLLVRPDGEPLRRPDHARAGLLHAVDAVQRLGSLGPSRPAGVERPPLLPRRIGAAVADRAGADPRLYTEAEGWQTSAHLRHGHRQPRPDRRRPARRSTSPARPTTSSRPSPNRERGADTTRTSPWPAARPPTGRTPVTTHPGRRRRGIPSSATSTTTASSTCSSPRATSRP